MKFGFNALSLVKGGHAAGVAYYIQNLLTALAEINVGGHHLVVYVRHDFHGLDSLAGSNIHLQRIPLPSYPRGIQFIARVLIEHLTLAFLTQRDALDVVHCPDHVLPLFWPVPTPRVLTIHDLTVFSHPQTHSPQTRLYFRSLIPRSVMRATRIVCDSSNTARDMTAWLGVRPEVMDVIPLGVAEIYHNLEPAAISASLTQFGLDYQGYILFLGTLEPRKNIDGLLRAYSQLVHQSAIDKKLVIAGKSGWFYQPLFDLVQQLNLSNQVIFTGYIPEAIAADLYNGALCFVYPSHYEGFGLPVLEAMACGAPVITSQVSSLPEIAGEAALLIDPADEGQLVEAMSAVIRNPVLRTDLRAKGLKQAHLFSWTRCARKTVSVWERAAKGKLMDEYLY